MSVNVDTVRMDLLHEIYCSTIASILMRYGYLFLFKKDHPINVE